MKLPIQKHFHFQHLSRKNLLTKLFFDHTQAAVPIKIKTTFFVDLFRILEKFKSHRTIPSINHLSPNFIGWYDSINRIQAV